jgi:hypothetical protein
MLLTGGEAGDRAHLKDEERCYPAIHPSIPGRYGIKRSRVDIGNSLDLDF